METKQKSEPNLRQPLQRKNTKITRKTYMTRADFMENIKIPKSTANRVIIPSNSSGNGFLLNCYKKEYLDKYITEEEFNKVVNHFSKLAQIAYSMKRKIDNKKLSKFVIYMFITAFIFLLVFFVSFYYGSIHEVRAVQYIAIGFLLASFVMVSLLLIKYALNKMPIFPTFEQMVKKSLDTYFANINKDYVERGLWWRVVPGHYWVELRIDQGLKEDMNRLEQLQKDSNIIFPNENMPSIVIQDLVKKQDTHKKHILPSKTKIIFTTEEDYSPTTIKHKGGINLEGYNKYNIPFERDQPVETEMNFDTQENLVGSQRALRSGEDSNRESDYTSQDSQPDEMENIHNLIDEYVVSSQRTPPLENIYYDSKDILATKNLEINREIGVERSQSQVQPIKQISDLRSRKQFRSKTIEDDQDTITEKNMHQENWDY